MDYTRTPGATPGTSYNGFAGQPAAPTPRARRRAPSRKAVLAGVAGAVGLGLVFGVLARPDFGDDGRAREPMRPAVTSVPVPEDLVVATPADEGMEILMNRPVIAPPARSAAPMEVMSPELIRAAPRPGTGNSRASTPAQTARTPSPVVVASAPRPSAPSAAPATGFRRAAARPSFDCNYARSRSEQLVCGDVDLAAADRRLDRAYRQALAAGVPPRVLRAYQDDWLVAREDAARDSAQAVASVYARRTRELEDLSETAPPDDGDGLF